MQGLVGDHLFHGRIIPGRENRTGNPPGSRGDGRCPRAIGQESHEIFRVPEHLEKSGLGPCESKHSRNREARALDTIASTHPLSPGTNPPHG